MNQTVNELLSQGFIITVLGMGLIFAALGVLWGLTALVARLSSAEPAEAPGAELKDAAQPKEIVPPAAKEILTAERAQVAAIVGAALMARAIPLESECPGSIYESEYAGSNWVCSNRGRALAPWQPPRFTEQVVTPQA